MPTYAVTPFLAPTFLPDSLLATAPHIEGPTFDVSADYKEAACDVAFLSCNHGGVDEYRRLAFRPLTDGDVIRVVHHRPRFAVCFRRRNGVWTVTDRPSTNLDERQTA